MIDPSSQYCKGMLRVVKESQPVWQVSCNFNCTQTGKNMRHLLELSEQSKVDNVFNTLRLGAWAPSCLKSSTQDSSKNRDKSSVKQPSPILPSTHAIFGTVFFCTEHQCGCAFCTSNAMEVWRQAHSVQATWEFSQKPPED